MPIEVAAGVLGCPLLAVEKHLGLAPLDKLRRGAEPPQITAEGIRELAERLAPAPPIDLALVRPRAALALARPAADGDTWLTTTAAAELLGVTQRIV